MSFLAEPGDISRTPLAAILLEVWNLRLSGSLTVEQGGGASRLFFRDGVPVGAQVYAGFRPLGHFLLAKGLIDIDVLERCLAEMARERRPQGEILIGLGAIDRPTLDAALSEQQAGYVSLIAALQEGPYRFDAGEAVPEWTRGIRIQPLRAIADALAAPQAAALVASTLAHVRGAIALGAGYPELAASFGWTLAEEALVAGLPGPADPLVAASGLPPEKARAALAALLLLGLADGSHGAEDAGAPSAVEVVVDLADIALRPAAPTAAASVAPLPAAPAPAPPAGKRSDPEEARARRQRLLTRAMQNMGVGPLSAPPPARHEAPRPDVVARAQQSGAEQAMRRALEFVMPRAREKDLFARLGLPKTAGPEDVKTAYHQLVKQFHPDKYAFPGLADLQPALKDLLASMNEAYSTLSDKAKRSEYVTRAGAGGAASSKEAAEAARVDYQKGEACHRTRDYGKARLFFEAAIRGDPRAEYHAALAGTILADPRAPDRDRVKELLAEATRDPACDRGLFLAGLVARQERNDALSEKMFRAALKANPKNADAVREVRLLDGRRQGRADDRGGAKK